MRRHLKRLRECVCSEEGVTAVEYSVMLALILLACVAAVQTLGCNVRESLRKTAETLAR